jgi:competence protein ComEC
MELLWPVADFHAPRDNDTSMVLATSVSGRRIMLNGDIQDLAMRGMFAGPTDLHADVTDLPHHGSFVDSSLRWFDAVNPSIVLQSTGPGRLRLDKWAQAMTARPSVRRMITTRSGALGVLVREDGSMQTWRFRSDGREETGESPEEPAATTDSP